VTNNQLRRRFEMKRWAIHIDLEGVSKIYEKDQLRVFRGLGILAAGIYQIGMTFCADTPNRLFVHQTGGDGFIIASEFAEGRPEFPVAVAVVLMRLVLQSGCLGKSGVSEGEFADIRATYPAIIRGQIDNSGVVRIGRGFIRLFPVMGTALINAYKVANRASGSVLLLDSGMAHDLSSTAAISVEREGFVAIDWIHADTPTIREVSKAVKPPIANALELRQYLITAVDAARAASIHHDWIENTLAFNRCEKRHA
jgi:hypothetical protein